MIPKGPIKLATIECAVCSAWIEVFEQYEPKLALIWVPRDNDADLCRHPPLTVCPQVLAEIGLRFPPSEKKRL